MSRHPSSFLVDTHPEIAATLVDQSGVGKVSTKSSRKMVWRCERGHEYVSTPARRTSGVGCPYCSGRLAIPGENDIATLRPDLARHMVDRSLATVLKPLSAKGVEWECDFGHRFVDTPFNVSRRETFCPECDKDGARRLGRRADGREKVLGDVSGLRAHDVACGPAAAPVGRKAQALPDSLVDEMVDKSNATLSASSHKRIEWECEKGHRWFAEVMSRARIGSGCPYCSGRLPVVGVNDLATTHPEIAAQLLHPELAQTVGAGSSKKLEWVCTKNPEHVWAAQVRMRTGVGRDRATGCPLCMNRGRRSDKRHMTLSEAKSPLLSEAVDPAVAGKYSLGSGAYVDWFCDRHNRRYVWSAQVAKRVLGEGCPLCAGKVVVRGENDLATTHPELAAELVDQSLAYSLSRGSEAKPLWRCEMGHEWRATVASRVAGNGCPVCSHTTSSGETELYEFVASLVGIDKVRRNVRGILPGSLELDVVVPEKAMAFEFNGLYWHSVDAGKSPDYHLRKFELAREAGYRLVQVWEDDWERRRDVVRRMLATKLGALDALGRLDAVWGDSHLRRLYARKLALGEVSGRAAKWFMEQNHVQGAVTATRHFALMDGDAPVAVMSVRSPENNVRTSRPAGVWEICRYATSCVVVGGFSRLMAHAERTLIAEGVDLRRWVSFSANDVSDGAMYARCGFEHERDVACDYKYAGRFTDCVRKSKECFQRRRFREDPGLVWDESWTEREAARQNGLWCIYDAGKVRWGKAVGDGGRSGAGDTSSVEAGVITGDVTAPFGEDLSSRLIDRFGETDVESVVIAGTSLWHIISRDLYVADLAGEVHGWHWLGEVVGEDVPASRLTQMRHDARLRDEMRSRCADFVAFFDERCWDVDLWLAMGAPSAHDWERSYSWLCARSLSAVPLPAKRGTSQTFTTIAKHYQHEVIFARELALWGDDAFLDKRFDKRRMCAALLVNRYHYLGKLPDELTDAEILRGIRIAGYVDAYSRYDAKPLLEFLEAHPEVRSVADPCAGWGERMLACASCGVSYEGVDVNVSLEAGYGRMVGELGLKDVSFQVADAASHRFGAADAIITCPPYGGTEVYSTAGAENLSAEEFRTWWGDVAMRCAKSGARWLCVTTNQACRETFVGGVQDVGFRLVSSVPVGRGHASHFNRKPGGVSTKREFEEFLVFERGEDDM